MSDGNQQTAEKYDPPKIEQEIIKFWEDNKIFEKSLELRKNGKKFVFLEGPPTANGLPHPGHVLTRTIKDVIARYKTMNGYYVERKAGWDTHGLPVEIEVEKLLGLKNKQEIEEYGIKKFNEECKKSVFKYEEAWKEMTKRVGFWIDMENPYITLKNDYIESVWWSLKKAWENGLLERGYRVTPYCPRCGTTLSSHEVAQGYKEVSDPSIFVKFKVKGKDEYFLAWTTTPWTLISNAALAVNPDEWYIKIEYGGEKIILSEERAEVLLKDEEYKILDGWKGKELIGTKYEPLYTYAKPDKECWYVIGADFVSMDEGTGIVHIAPAFGEDDYEAGQKYGLPVIQLVKKDGTFPPEVEKWAGMFVKDADKEIIEDLKSRGLLMSVQEYVHQYPFCWRCNSPLLYYAIESWFIKMSKLRKQLVENNEKIKWHPEYLKHGRFGEFIKEVRDWSLSRKRYWGTPLPVWKCEECGNEICVGSVDELKKLAEDFPEEYDLHRPFVDELDVKCPKCGGKMRREKEVIDAWYDSGSAFFAQWHYPFDTPYKEVLSLGHILDENGLKMSKKARNYIEPNKIFDREGADAMRWYLISASAPWSPKRFYEQVVRDALGKFLLTLWNTYSFYSTYSALDNFDYSTKKVEFEERSLLDKWIISRLNEVIKSVIGKIENFELHKAAREIEEFVVGDISNWYIRNSRKRFWLEEETLDKLAGYSTIHELLTTLSRLLAPFVPFISEKIYRSLGGGESVHLSDYPSPDEKKIDKELEAKMEKVREITEVARSLRAKKGIKVRYPLSKAIVITSADISDMVEILKEEINVKEVEFSDSIEPFMGITVKPNYSSLGPKFKGNAGKVASAIEQLSSENIKGAKINIDGEEYELSEEDYLIEKKEKEGFAVGSSGDDYVVLCTEQTPELIAEGFSREIIRRIQEMRKDMNLDMEDKIISSVSVDSDRVKGWENYIKGETRSEKLVFGKASGDMVKEWDIDGEKIKIGIKRL